MQINIDEARSSCQRQIDQTSCPMIRDILLEIPSRMIDCRMNAAQCQVVLDHHKRSTGRDAWLPVLLMIQSACLWTAMEAISIKESVRHANAAPHSLP